jgi:histone H2A
MTVVSFASFISKIAAQIHPELLLSTPAKCQLNEFALILIRLIAGKSHKLLGEGSNVTIKEKHVRGAVMFIFEGKLLQNALSEGAKAIESYNDPSNTGNQAKKAKLLLSPSRVFTMLKRYSPRVSPLAAIYTAAVVEYILREFLDIAGQIARQNKKSKIIVAHLQQVTQDNADIKEFSHTNMIFFLDKTFRKKGGAKQSKGGKRRHKTGTVAKHLVKKQQKSDTLAVFHTTFTNNWKRAGAGEGFRTSNSAKLTVHQFCEKVITWWVTKANELKEREKPSSGSGGVAKNSNGKEPVRTLDEKHLLIARDMLNLPFNLSFGPSDRSSAGEGSSSGQSQDQDSKEVNEYIGKTIEAAQRIAHRAGSERNSLAAKQLIAKYLVSLAVEVVNSAANITSLNKKVGVNKPTISYLHVQQALSLHGIHVTVCRPKSIKALKGAKKEGDADDQTKPTSGVQKAPRKAKKEVNAKSTTEKKPVTRKAKEGKEGTKEKKVPAEKKTKKPAANKGSPSKTEQKTQAKSTKTKKN